MKNKLILLLILVFTLTFGINNVSADVAKINDETFSSLSGAITEAVKTEGKKTIILIDNVEDNVTIPKGADIVLDLNGYTLSNHANATVIANNGTLEIKNGTITSNAGSGMINNNSKATLTISSGNLIATGTRQAIYNDGGTLYITDAYIESSSEVRAAIQNRSNGKIYIKDGTIVSKKLYAIYNEKGTLNIGNKDDYFVSSKPVIQGKTYGVAANNGYNFYDGIIKGEIYPVGKTSDTGNTPTVTNDEGATKINEIEVDSQKDLDETNGTLTCSIDPSIRSMVTFDPNGGSVNPTYKKVYAGNSIGTLPTPTKIDHIFEGWFTLLTGGDKINENTKPNHDVTYYAHWTYVNPNTVALVEGVGLKSLADALAIGGKITLQSDVVVSSSLFMNKETTLDLNGHIIALEDNSIVIKEKVTITDSSENKTGKITSNAQFTITVGRKNESTNGYLIHKSGTIEGLGEYGAILNYETVEIDGGTVKGTAILNSELADTGYVVYNLKNLIMKSGVVYSTNGRAVNLSVNSTFTMDGGLVKTDATKDQAVQLSSDCSATINSGIIEALNDDSAGIAMFKNTQLTVNGGTIKGSGMAVAGNGNEKSSNANITINDGELISTSGVGMYLPQRDSITVINGGSISGPTGIEIRASQLIVNGGTITGTSESFTSNENGNGTTTTGSAIAVSQHTTKQPIHVIINGGNLKAAVPLTEVNPMNNPPEAIELVIIEVNQGDFESTGFDTVETGESIPVIPFITGGTYTVVPTKYIKDGYGDVKLDDNKYEVTKIHQIEIDSSSVEIVTIDKNQYPYKTNVELEVEDKEGFETIIEVKTEEGNLVEVKNKKFMMPDSDITITVNYEEIVKPKTGDNIVFYISLFILSILGLLGVSITRKKIFNK